MLDVELVPANNVSRAAEIFFRDGFVALIGVLTDDQLTYAGKAPIGWWPSR